MVGRTLSDELYRRRRTADELRKAGAKVLSVQDISMGAMSCATSFSVYRGARSPAFSG